MNEQYISSKFQGKDFKNTNLEGRDFSEADIRGADFSYTDLTNAKFRQAQAGLTSFWKNILASFCLLLALLAGLISAYGAGVIGFLVMDDAEQLSLFGFLASITIAIFWLIFATRGLGTLKSLADVMAVGLIVTTFLVAVIAFAPEEEFGLKIALGAELTVLGLAGIIGGILDMALGVAIAKEISFPKFKLLLGGLAILGAVLGAILGTKQGGAFFIVGIVVIITIILGIHIGLQAISSNQKYWLIRWLTINIVAIGSTKFIGANLTDADFTQANLTHADFSNANLTRTCWSQAKGLDFARREVSSSYEIVELSLGDSINPQAAALALQQLKQKYADKFELLAVEGTENNNLKLHSKITKSDDFFQLSDELKQIYRQNQLSPDSTREILLKENYKLLEKIFTKAIEKPTYYQNVNIGKGNYNENIEGGYTDKSRNLDISGNAQVEASGAGALSLGDNYETIANTINQLPNSDSEPDKEKLKQLLEQLQTSVLDAELDKEETEESLEQIKAISYSLTNSQDSTVKKTAKRAMKMLQGTAAALPPNTAMTAICNQLPELINNIFDL